MCDYQTLHPLAMRTHIDEHIHASANSEYSTDVTESHHENPKAGEELPVETITSEPGTLDSAEEMHEDSLGGSLHSEDFSNQLPKKENFAIPSNDRGNSDNISSQRSDIATNALIGCLELRKVKSVAMSKSLPQKSVKSWRSANPKFAYRHSESVAISFVSNNDVVLATSSGAKVVEENIKPESVNNCSNQIVVAIESGQVANSGNVESQAQVGVNTISPRNHFSTDVSHRNSVRMPESANQIQEHSKTGLPSSRKRSGSLLDTPTPKVLTLKLSQVQIGQLENSVQPPFAKKPKKDILFRYQKELNQESTPKTNQAENTHFNEPSSELDENRDRITIMSEIPQPIAKISKAPKLAKGPLSITDPTKSTLPEANLRRKSAQMEKFKLSIKKCLEKISKQTLTTNTNSVPQLNLRPIDLETEKLPELHGDVSINISAPKPANKTVALQNLTYKCDFCSYSTNKKAKLMAHVNKKHVHEEPMYVCDICDYLTSRESKLLAHKRSHKLPEKAPNSETKSDELPLQKTAKVDDPKQEASSTEGLVKCETFQLGSLQKFVSIKHVVGIKYCENSLTKVIRIKYKP